MIYSTSDANDASHSSDPNLATYSYGDRVSTLKQSLLDLLCSQAYKEGEFVLSSGQSSSYYINGKLATLHAQGGQLVGQVLLPMIGHDVVAVAGLTLGADPIVSAVNVVAAYEGRSLTGLIVRKKAKDHGTKAYIEGPSLPPGSPIVVLEDVVTTGKSAMQAVERLRDAGYQVTQIITLVDRQQGGAEFYREQGLEFAAVFSIADLQARWKTLQSSP